MEIIPIIGGLLERIIGARERRRRAREEEWAHLAAIRAALEQAERERQMRDMVPLGIAILVIIALIAIKK